MGAAAAEVDALAVVAGDRDSYARIRTPRAAVGAVTAEYSWVT